MSGVRGRKGYQGDIRMGFSGAAGEPEGLKEGAVPWLRKPEAATHVASP